MVAVGCSQANTLHWGHSAGKKLYLEVSVNVLLILDKLSDGMSNNAFYLASEQYMNIVLVTEPNLYLAIWLS